MQKTQVLSLAWENPLEKGMAIHSSILAWRIPWTEESGGLYSPCGHKELDTTEHQVLDSYKNINFSIVKYSKSGNNLNGQK